MYAGILHRFRAWLFAFLLGLAIHSGALAKDINYVVNNEGTGVATCQAFTSIGGGGAVWRKTFSVGPGMSTVYITTLTDNAVTFTLKYGGAGLDYTSPDSYTENTGGSGTLNVGVFRVSSSGAVLQDWYIHRRICNDGAVSQDFVVEITPTDPTFVDLVRLGAGECVDRTYGPFTPEAAGDPPPVMRVKRITWNPDGTESLETIDTSGPSDWTTAATPPGTPTTTTGEGNSLPGYGSSEEEGYQGPIDHSGSDTSSDLAKEKTLRHVGDAVYNVLSQGFAEVINQERKIDGSINQVKSRIDTSNAKLDLVWSKLNEVKSTIDGSNTRLDGIEDEAETANANLVGIKGSTDANGVKLNSMDISLADIRANGNTANGHLTDIKANTAGVKGAIDGTTNYTGDVKRSVDGTTNWLSGILGRLPKYRADGDSDGSVHKASAEAVHSATKDTIDAQASFHGNAIANINGTTFSPGTMFDLTVPIIGSFSINPMNDANIAAVAPWFRNFARWSISAGIVYACFMAVFTTLQAAGAWAQTKGVTEQTPILGTISSIVSAVGYRLIIGAALATIPALWLSWQAGNATIYGALGGNPLAGAHPMISACLWLLDQFFPIVLAVTAPLIVLGFKASLLALIWIKQMVIRFLPA